MNAPAQQVHVPVGYECETCGFTCGTLVAWRRHLKACALFEGQTNHQVQPKKPTGSALPIRGDQRVADSSTLMLDQQANLNPNWVRSTGGDAGAGQPPPPQWPEEAYVKLCEREHRDGKRVFLSDKVPLYYECLCGFTSGTDAAFKKHTEKANQLGSGWHMQKRAMVGKSRFVYSFPEAECAHKKRTPLRDTSKQSLATPGYNPPPGSMGSMGDQVDGIGM